MAVKEFCKSLDYRVIVKPIVGTSKAPVLTNPLRPEHLETDINVSLSPAIYQQRVDGNRHLRVCCFGPRLLAFLIRSDFLDWRVDLRVPVELTVLDESLAMQLRQILNVLDLRMGVFDLKLAQDGVPWWFEVNPQGQFLFLQGLTGVDLIGEFSAYLYDELVDGDL